MSPEQVQAYLAQAGGGAAVAERTAPAAEASPAPATSPAEPGQGARADEQQAQPQAQETAPRAPAGAKEAQADTKDLRAQLQKLQSQVDKSRNVNARLQSQLADVQSDYATAITQLESIQAQAQAPDPYRDPEASAKYWQGKLREQFNRTRTEQVISTELTKLAVETGVIVTKEDKRLRFTSEQAFLESLAGIRQQIKERAMAEERDKAREAEIEARVRAKVMKDLGVDRFDGGSGGAAVERKYGPGDKVPLSKIQDPAWFAANKQAAWAAYNSGNIDRSA